MVMSILLAVLSSRGSSGTGEGVLQQRARAQAGQLPPSTGTLNPQAALDSLTAQSEEEGAGLNAPPAADTTNAPSGEGAEQQP